MYNPSGGSNLPNRGAVEHILQEIYGLLFPGFREDTAWDKKQLYLLTGERVYALAGNLVREIRKCLAFELRESGQKNLGGCSAAAEMLVMSFLDELPHLRATLSRDLEAAFNGDPAARSREEVIIAYPGFDAITTHRIAHFFWKKGTPLIPRVMSEIIHSRTGIDIHPGAEIGEGFFIDHGTGVVIGETTVIGRNVKIYQGVTLGALSVSKDKAGKKRHPTIEDGVTIYANATILGGETVVGEGSLIGASVWLVKSVPAASKVYNGY
jgi:serine O-acetyltransferase